MLKKLSLLLLIVLVSAGCIKKSTDDSQDVPEHIQQAAPTATPTPTPSVTSSPSQATLPPSQQVKVTNYVTYKGVEGKNALELLKASYTIETKTFSGVGEFVESIAGVKPDSKHFWAFYVNGKSSNVGASSYVTKNGDTIEWKLEEIK